MKKQTIIVLIAVGLFLLIISGIASYFLFFNKPDENKPINTSNLINKEVKVFKNEKEIGNVWIENGEILETIDDPELDLYIKDQIPVWEELGGSYPSEDWGADGSRSYGLKLVSVTDPDFINVIYVALDDNFNSLGYEFDIVEK